MSKRCCALQPILDQSSVVTLSIETTGPLLNTGPYACECGECGTCRRGRRRRHRR